MADIVQSIDIHNSDVDSHPFLLSELQNRANIAHVHIAQEITDLKDAVIAIVESDVFKDSEYEDNKGEPAAQLYAVSQALLNAEITRIEDNFARKIHTHLREDILDFEHTHENLYYSKMELMSILENEEGASLIGATIENFIGENVQDLLNELKKYSDENRNNFFVKNPVKVVATQNITTLEGVRHSIDGIEDFRTGDRVLLVGQNDNRKNGIYIIHSSAWERSEDFNSNDDLAKNILVFINEGLENVNTGWRLEVKANDIGGVPQSLVIEEVAIIGKPFSYNRNLRSSNTIELQVDTTNNVLMPELKIVLGELPADATFARIQCDKYGRVISGDLLGPHGNDFLLEDYNIRDVLTEDEVRDVIQNAIDDLEGNVQGDLVALTQLLKDYSDDGIDTHNNDVNAHTQLANKIVNLIYASESTFAHKHNDLYFTKAQMQDFSSALNSGATLVGVGDIDGINLANGMTKNVQNYLEALKKYTDSIAQSLDIKHSVYVATTSNIVLSDLQTIDGILLEENQRVLVKNQIDKTTNGLYLSKAGIWIRSDDADTGDKLDTGTFTFVEHGDTWHDTGWVLSTLNPIVIGTSELEFVQFSSAGVVEAGQGLRMEGNTIFMPTLHDNSKVFTKVTIDVMGNVIGGDNPTTLAGMGITDTYTKVKIDDLLSLKAGLNVATATTNGLMSKENWQKLNDIETGAEVNQNAYAKVSLGAETILAQNKQDTLKIILGTGLAGTISQIDNSVSLNITNHDHEWSDITDRPTKLPADGGNADTVGDILPAEIALREEWIGGGVIDDDINPLIEAGIEKHNLDPAAHPELLTKLIKKADLVSGKIPMEQLPITLNLGPVKTAIVGVNGNWWNYDDNTSQYVDSDLSASSGRLGPAGPKGDKGDQGMQGEQGEKGDSKTLFGIYAQNSRGGSQFQVPPKERYSVYINSYDWTIDELRTLSEDATVEDILNYNGEIVLPEEAGTYHIVLHMKVQLEHIDLQKYTDSYARIATCYPWSYNDIGYSIAIVPPIPDEGGGDLPQEQKVSLIIPCSKKEDVSSLRLRFQNLSLDSRMNFHITHVGIYQ